MALDVPEGVRSALSALVPPDRSELRPVRADALHVTLVFLGWQEEDAIDAIATAALAAVPAAAAPVFAALDVRALPSRRPRLFALALDDEQSRAARLQAAVSEALGAWYTPEKRPFWPHVTLARVRRGASRVAGWPSSPAPPREPFAATALTLYRSILRRDGAVYEPLARRDLIR